MNAQYFINKFEAIPEDWWTVGHLFDTYGNCCANGLCGVRRTWVDGVNTISLTREGAALHQVFLGLPITPKEGVDLTDYHDRSGYSGTAAAINNGYAAEYQQATPKQRILAALRDIQTREQQDKAVEQVQKAIDQPLELV
jgi:hypothetical protein